MSIVVLGVFVAFCAIATGLIVFMPGIDTRDRLWGALLSFALAWVGLGVLVGMYELASSLRRIRRAQFDGPDLARTIEQAIEQTRRRGRLV